MRKSATSLLFFGIYVILIGVVLCIMPAAFVDLLKLPVIPDAWGRFIGLLAIVIGTYDILSGYYKIVPLIRASVFIRVFFFFSVLLLFITGQMPAEILPIGIIDLLGAGWTYFALTKESAKTQAQSA